MEEILINAFATVLNETMNETMDTLNDVTCDVKQLKQCFVKGTEAVESALDYSIKSLPSYCDIFVTLMNAYFGISIDTTMKGSVKTFEYVNGREHVSFTLDFENEYQEILDEIEL